MCLSAPSASPAPAQQVAPPPPPPAKSPNAPVIDAKDQNARDGASAVRKGTSIFRNDLTIPTGKSGNGVNIPGA